MLLLHIMFVAMLSYLLLPLPRPFWRSGQPVCPILTDREAVQKAARAALRSLRLSVPISAASLPVSASLGSLCRPPFGSRRLLAVTPTTTTTTTTTNYHRHVRVQAHVLHDRYHFAIPVSWASVHLPIRSPCTLFVCRAFFV